MNDYQPKDPERYERMLKFFRNCDTKETLESAAVLFIADEAFPRPDIAAAVKVRELEISRKTG